MSVPSRLINQYAKTFLVSVFCKKKNGLAFLIQNPKGHENCIDGLKVTAILMTKKVCFLIIFLRVTLTICRRLLT